MSGMGSTVTFDMPVRHYRSASVAIKEKRQGAFSIERVEEVAHV
jgi:hypothetical protein